MSIFIDEYYFPINSYIALYHLQPSHLSVEYRSSSTWSPSDKEIDDLTQSDTFDEDLLELVKQQHQLSISEDTVPYVHS